MARRLACGVAIVLATSVIVLGQAAASVPVDTLLRDRIGMAAGDVARFSGGDIVVWNVPGTASNEIAGAGAMRTKGDLRRLAAWLRDIEAFIKATGTVNVGAIAQQPTAADFARINFDDVDLGSLSSCRPGRCDFRMPAAYIDRFQKGVDWKTADARTTAAALARTLIGEYAAAYQKGGDAALGAHHDQKSPNAIAEQFQDMLRRATKVWDLAHPFASYLETFPQAAPAGTESRFYWTRDQVGKHNTLTLHHVVLQQFPDGRLLLADKQFYASRQFDAALMIALAVPNADYTAFDLVVSIKARADAVGGIAGRVLRGRIEKEIAEGMKVYLQWIRDSLAL